MLAFACPLISIVNLRIKMSPFSTRERIEVGNYRLISLVDYLFGVFEKLVISRFQIRTRNCRLFSQAQFGFERSRLTELEFPHL